MLRSLSRPTSRASLRPEPSHTNRTALPQHDGRGGRMFPPPASASGEIYGFVFYVLSILAFAIYLGWAFLPDSLLRSLGGGTAWYPSRCVS